MEASKCRFDQNFNKKLLFKKAQIISKDAKDLSFQEMWLLALPVTGREITKTKTFKLNNNGTKFMYNECHEHTLEVSNDKKMDRVIFILKCVCFLNISISLKLLLA